MSISRIDSLKLQAELAQFVLALNPQTRLNIELAAPVCNKTAATFRVDVTRRPECLPKLTRVGRRVFVRVADLLEFISAPQPQQPHPQPQPLRARPGRPTNAERAARKGGAR
jgi:hypothetical protein